MAKLFQRSAAPVQAAVTHIPGESDVDPDVLEQTAADPSTGKDYRDSNQDDRFGNRVTNVTGSLAPGQEHTELVRWAKDGRRHIALRMASTKQVVASWWNDHIDQAILSGDLDPEDMHTAAFNYASKHGLLPKQLPNVEGKQAALFNRAPVLTFVSPTSPEWDAFVEQLRDLPDGMTLKTQDGYTLTKEGDTFGDGDILFALEDFHGAAQHLMPPMAIG